MNFNIVNRLLFIFKLWVIKILFQLMFWLKLGPKAKLSQISFNSEKNKKIMDEIWIKDGDWIN